MNINLEQIKALDPCPEGIIWYTEHGSPDLLTTLLKVNEYRYDWSSWLFARLMTRKQNIQIAIFAGQQVLSLFEAKYPNDKRPREAIEAAKRVLEDNTEKSINSARAAYYAAVSASDRAASSSAAVSAVTAASLAAYTHATAGPAYTYTIPGPTEYCVRIKIINEAVRILDEGEKK